MLQSSNFIIVWKSSPVVNPNVLIGSYPVHFHGRIHKPYSFCSLKNEIGPIFSILVTFSTRKCECNVMSSFCTGRNAVTLRPSCSASDTNVRVSTKVPLSETHYEAMNFTLWRSIGKEFLIKGYINNWIACKEGSGSIVK